MFCSIKQPYYSYILSEFYALSVDNVQMQKIYRYNMDWPSRYTISVCTKYYSVKEVKIIVCVQVFLTKKGMCTIA